MLRLSFIVPFYNAEPYIGQCICSLYDQDIPQSEYEVICVDDCSPDGSRAIVERLQKEYPTLKLLIHTENKRQGGARNTGLNAAQGRYIWFVDSDDYIKPNCLKDLIVQAERENLDILKFYFDRDNRQEEMLASNRVVSGSQLMFDVQTNFSLAMRSCSAVQQIIKREFLQDEDIVFAEKVQYEDDDFSYQLHAFAKRTRLIAQKPYVVRNTPNSTTRRKNDFRRVHDIYALSVRMIALKPILMRYDERWERVIHLCIDDSFNNYIFPILVHCTLFEQLYFWNHTRTHVKCFRPYLSRKSYAKLSSYLLWRLLQK